MKPAEVLTQALESIEGGATRTRPVTVSLPAPLADALQQLAQAGVVVSTSAAATEALTTWTYNRLLRMTLDELYDSKPALRPTPAQIREMASELGVTLPPAARPAR